MKQSFTDNLKLSKANIERLETINSILEDYREDGYVLTLRQLYYQLVVRDIIPNQQAEYSKLSNILKKGRMAGIVDWSIIEDRLRQPFLPYWVFDIDDAINDTINTYRLNRMDWQDKYIEIRVEKDALSGVLKRVSSKYHINLMVNRGYSLSLIHIWRCRRIEATALAPQCMIHFADSLSMKIVIFSILEIMILADLIWLEIFRKD